MESLAPPEPVEFYRDAVGAIVIPDSEPGIYTDLLK